MLLQFKKAVQGDKTVKWDEDKDLTLQRGKEGGIKSGKKNPCMTYNTYQRVLLFIMLFLK